MKFQPSGETQIRKPGLFIAGIITAAIGPVMYFVLGMVLSEIMPEQNDIMLFQIMIMIPFILFGVGMIWSSLFWSSKEYFLLNNGKCGILKNIYCPGGDCRNCNFAEGYIRENMYNEETKP